MAQPVKLYICSAPADTKAVLALEKRLMPLKRSNLLQIWHKGKLLPGDTEAQEIAIQLNQAQTIIMLISSNFFTSEHYESAEMIRALDILQEAKVRVIPVILDYCLWQETELGGLQPLPEGGKPVGSEDKAWQNVVIGIQKIATHLQTEQEKEEPPASPIARSKARTLSTKLYHRLHQAFTEFEEFDSHQHLCEFIAKGELAVYQPWFLKSEYVGKAERIEKAVNYLRRQRLQGRQPALPLFLMALRDTLLEGDALLDELDEIMNEVVSELEELEPPHRMLPLTLETENSFASLPHRYDDTSSISTVGITTTNVPLNPKDREWIVGIVDTIIDPMGIDGRKNLLRPCNFPESVISSISYDKGTRLVAEAMVGLIERREILNSDVCYLEVFLNSMIEMDSSIDNRTRSRLLDIITVYKQARTQVSESTASHNGTISHKSISFVEGQIFDSLDSHIMQGLQKAREHYQTKPASSQYKIDAGTIIQCNLHEQKTGFWHGFGGRYKGTFTFTVASIDRRILKEYVIEGLIWELKQHINRPLAPVRHVYLSLENLDCSSWEQGVTSLYKEIEQQLSIQSISDLLSEDQETNVVIVIWHKDIPLDNLRLIALQFSETLNERVKDILYQQGRCLILLWATYGFSSIESLDVPIALPVFERFELDHLSEWLEYEVSTQLRNQNVPEQKIRYCWERIVMKIKRFEGRLPETYEVLRESLELGGIL